MRLSMSCPHSAISGRSYITQDPLALCSSLRHVLKMNAQGGSSVSANTEKILAEFNTEDRKIHQMTLSRV